MLCISQTTSFFNIFDLLHRDGLESELEHDDGDEGAEMGGGCRRLGMAPNDLSAAQDSLELEDILEDDLSTSSLADADPWLWEWFEDELLLE